jgi:uncharacterized membrane protein YeaQ/YmgE (transglycosylase-associated protein family)
MNILEFLILVLVAGVCGSIGAAIIGARHMSFLVLIAVGLIGALLGRWLSAQLGVGEMFNVNIGGTQIPILWTIVGSMLLTGIASLFWRRWAY